VWSGTDEDFHAWSVQAGDHSSDPAFIQQAKLNTVTKLRHLTIAMMDK